MQRFLYVVALAIGVLGLVSGSLSITGYGIIVMLAAIFLLLEDRLPKRGK